MPKHEGSAHEDEKEVAYTKLQQNKCMDGTG